MDEEYSSVNSVEGFVAFDSFTAETDGYFTIPDDYVEFSLRTYYEPTETLTKKVFCN